jgi:hypothetical protein
MKVATIFVSIGLPVVVAFLAVVWFLVRQDERVASLELRVKTLSSAPSISRQSESGGPPIVAPNPLLAACADLATREADASVKSDYTVWYDIKEEMQELKCSN